MTPSRNLTTIESIVRLAACTGCANTARPSAATTRTSSARVGEDQTLFRLLPMIPPTTVLQLTLGIPPSDAEQSINPTNNFRASIRRTAPDGDRSIPGAESMAAHCE